ncbi:MAG TPA: hypothetical protein DDW52_14675 [Planctomycetaceae bacterium]|nr:hypothetical protein [Planctomycetaceae bacterium]
MLRIRQSLVAILVAAGLVCMPPSALSSSVSKFDASAADSQGIGGQRPLVLNRKALYSPKFYDLVCEHLLSGHERTKEAALWLSALRLELERNELSDWQKQLVELRLGWLQSTFAANESSLSSEDQAAVAEVAEKSVVGDVSFTSCPPHAQVELSVLPTLLDAKGLPPTGYDQWQTRFLKQLSLHDDWQPSCKSMLYQLASDIALTHSQHHDATKWAVLAVVLADADGHAVLRRTSRERLLAVFEQIGRRDSEIAQLATFQLAARERVPDSTRQLTKSATSALELEQVEHVNIKMLSRRIAVAGPDFTLANGKKLTQKNYCLCALHTLSQPGPLLPSRKRVALFAESLKVAEEQRDDELAIRLRVYFKNSLLHRKRFDRVLDGAVELAREVANLNNRSLELQLSVTALLASELSTALKDTPNSTDSWSVQVDQLIEALITTPQTADTRWSPNRVLASLANSNLQKRVTKSDFKPFVSRVVGADSRSPQERLNTTATTPGAAPGVKTADVDSSPLKTAPTKWASILGGVGSVAGLVGLVWLAISRKTHLHVPESDAGHGNAGRGTNLCPASTENIQEDLRAQVSSEAALPHAAELFHLRDLLETVVAQLSEPHAKQVGLASDPGGELDRTLRGDAPKIELLLASLAKEMVRCPLIGRVMLSGRVEQSGTHAESTLEVSLTYHLPKESMETAAARKMHSNRWIENPTAARLVALLHSDIEHNLDPGGIGCLVVRIKIASVANCKDASRSGTTADSEQNACRVLVVDPDELAHTSLKAACQVLGQECDVARCWTSEIAQQCRDGKYAAVMVDQSLMAGRLATYMWQQLRESNPGMLLVALQGDDLLEIPEGVDHAIGKPVSLTEMTRVIGQARASLKKTKAAS